MRKHTILFLAANPSETDRLALDREAREIQVELERSRWRDRFELVTRWAAEPLDLLRELRRLAPTVVQFSGHGGHQAADPAHAVPRPARDVVGDSGRPDAVPCPGLFFQGSGRPQLKVRPGVQAGQVVLATLTPAEPGESGTVPPPQPAAAFTANGALTLRRRSAARSTRSPGCSPPCLDPRLSQAPRRMSKGDMCVMVVHETVNQAVNHVGSDRPDG